MLSYTKSLPSRFSPLSLLLLSAQFILPPLLFGYEGGHGDTQLSASIPPTPVKIFPPTPTPTVAFQHKASPGSLLLFTMAMLSVAVAAGVWARSPGPGRCYGRLNREPPPPPPPPPQEQHNETGNDEDGQDGEHGGDGDDPQVTNNSEGRNGDGLETAASPAPEDPPPPSGNVQEDDYNGVSNGENYWWLLLFLLEEADKMWRSRFRTKTDQVEGSIHTPQLTLDTAPPSAPPKSTLPGLLSRQVAFLLDPPIAARSPPSIISGLFGSLPPPNVCREVPSVLPPTPPPAPFPTAPSVTPTLLARMAFWCKIWLSVMAVPVLGTLGAVLHSKYVALPTALVLAAPPLPPLPPLVPPPPPPREVDSGPLPPPLAPPPPTRQEASDKLLSLLQRTTVTRAGRKAQDPQDAAKDEDRLLEIQQLICLAVKARPTIPELVEEDPERLLQIQRRICQTVGTRARGKRPTAEKDVERKPADVGEVQERIRRLIAELH